MNPSTAWTLYLSSKIATGAVHFRYGSPLTRLRAISLSGVHPGDAVEAAEGVDTAVVAYDAYPWPSVAHWVQQRPLTCLWIVHFCWTEALLSVEPSTDVDFTWK